MILVIGCAILVGIDLAKLSAPIALLSSLHQKPRSILTLTDTGNWKSVQKETHSTSIYVCKYAIELIERAVFEDQPTLALRIVFY